MYKLLKSSQIKLLMCLALFFNNAYAFTTLNQIFVPYGYFSGLNDSGVYVYFKEPERVCKQIYPGGFFTYTRIAPNGIVNWVNCYYQDTVDIYDPNYGIELKGITVVYIQFPSNSNVNQKSTPDTNLCDGTNNSISFNAGNEVIRETDYTEFGENTYSFSRTYNSNPIVTYDGQGQWRNLLSRSIKPNYATMVAYRAGGKAFVYNAVGTTWVTDNDINDKLEEIKNTSGIRTGWKYTSSVDDNVETYDASGKLLTITNRAGLTQTISYDSNNRAVSISDPLSRNLYFLYNDFSRIAQMTNPAGGIYSYSYNINGSLNAVTFPDGVTKTYLYGYLSSEQVNVSSTPNSNIDYADALTGVIDENGSRYATYRYDAAGRAYDEELAPDLGLQTNQKIGHNNLTYNPGIATIVKDPLGSSRTYNFTNILGVVKSTGQTQPAGSGCAASAAALTYDANGNVASRTDFNGNMTTYTYDLSRNLETSRTEGLTSAGATTGATRTITTTWHPTWRLPLVTSEYTGSTATGTPLRSSTNIYDDKGNITSITEADPIHAISRTTTVTYTYSTVVPGLVINKVVDGPRSDVSDVTTYNYYDANATCTPSNATPLIDPITNSSPINLGCRGQLLSVTNALNQTTTFDRYNHHGQVEQMTDANGLVTTYTYDLRQRLLSKAVSGTNIATQTTSLTYDGVGQVTQLALPDGSQLNYSYDAAHRLTQVQDNLGNKVHYTLDTTGNRINETTTDPNNVLTKTLTRSYDALNRLQQVIGVQ